MSDDEGRAANRSDESISGKVEVHVGHNARKVAYWAVFASVVSNIVRAYRCYSRSQLVKSRGTWEAYVESFPKVAVPGQRTTNVSDARSDTQ